MKFARKFKSDEDTFGLLELEKRRKMILVKFETFRIFTLAFIFLFVFLFLNFVFDASLKENLGDFTGKILAILIALFLTFVAYNNIFYYFMPRQRAEFSAIYKDMFLTPFIRSMGFKYEQFGHVGMHDALKSGLFGFFDEISGGDMVSGEIDGVNFAFSHINLEDLRGDEVRALKFSGLFFVADFAKFSREGVYIAPKGRASPRGDRLIAMDNAKFNAEFDVYSDDMQAAMYVLSPALMERILRLKFRFIAPVSLSFTQRKIFIRLDGGLSSFEPDIKRSVIGANLAPVIKNDILALLEIVEILNL